MIKSKVHTLQDAFAYLADCQLATVARLGMMKSRGKADYERQIAIGQTFVTWITEFEVDPDGTRADEVINNHNGSVAAWAKHFETPKGT
jgi:hypothetical protein